MSTPHVSRMIFVSAAAAMTSISALADCPVSIKHPEKVPFRVTNSVTSDVNLNNPDIDSCNIQLLKQVPIWIDDTFSYATECAAYSYGDGYDEGQPMSWADVESGSQLGGRILENGFRMDVVLDGYVSAYNGSTAIDNELYATYRFTLENDARFTFSSFYHLSDGNNMEVSVFIVDLGRGFGINWTDYFTEGREQSEPIPAGTYEIRTRITYHQDGCDETLFLAVSEVDMHFYCEYFYRIGDINKDDIINGNDLALLLAAFNSYNADCDLNGDGKVDGADLSYLLANWG
ncbi:MAG: hypothetical protein MK179_22990 [Pirellulaceae bacterium]|nr:hypothetical protein [Pirellulaceae bacterium]